jgi:hypothetical protein
MKDNQTTYNLDKSKLSRLLKLGLKNSKRKVHSEDSNQKAAVLWKKITENPLPVDDLNEDILPDALASFCQNLGLLAGQSINSLLMDSDTDLAKIEMIKAYAKICSRQSKSEVEYQTANALYYAALSHALIHHKTKMTKFSYSDLGNSFNILRKTKWLGIDYIYLFERAYNYCLAKQK